LGITLTICVLRCGKAREASASGSEIETLPYYRQVRQFGFPSIHAERGLGVGGRRRVPPAQPHIAAGVALLVLKSDAEEHFLKAELVLRLDKAINSLGLTQRAAARRIGATQPELSKILGGKFSEVSLERLMRFLTALGCHIEIKIGAGQENKAGDVTIKDVRRSAA
jgi:predicted XRE-type DNA-binding protein